MLDLIQFIITLFTSPLEAIATIALVVVLFGGMRWFATRPRLKALLDAPPESILRHHLKFTDADLEQNRLTIMSSSQIRRIRKEFLIFLVFYLVLLSFFGWFIVMMFWDDIGWGRIDPVMAVLLAFMGLTFLFISGVAGFQLRTYLRDIRTKKALALLTTLVFEENKGEYLGFKFQTHQYKIVVRDARLPAPLPLPVGFMTEDAWDEVLKLENQPVILYIAPNTSKLLSFDLLLAKQDVKHDHI